jgi:TRAP-type uncharacterized transport system fused permease subunit
MISTGSRFYRKIGFGLRPDLTVGLSAEEMKCLPSVTSVASIGYHFVLPIVILLWCVLVNRLSPGFSAYWACMATETALLGNQKTRELR